MRTVFIDLSAKIEEWRLDSVLAMTDGGETILIVPAKVKRDARDWLKAHDTHKRKEATYIYRLLASVVFLAAESELNSIDRIVIDADYPGERPSAAIKNELIPLANRANERFRGRQIHFQPIKGSRADVLARTVFQAKQRTGRVITLQDIVGIWL